MGVIVKACKRWFSKRKKPEKSDWRTDWSADVSVTPTFQDLTDWLLDIADDIQVTLNEPADYSDNDPLPGLIIYLACDHGEEVGDVKHYAILICANSPDNIWVEPKSTRTDRFTDIPQRSRVVVQMLTGTDILRDMNPHEGYYLINRVLEARPVIEETRAEIVSMKKESMRSQFLKQLFE